MCEVGISCRNRCGVSLTYNVYDMVLHTNDSLFAVVLDVHSISLVDVHWNVSLTYSPPRANVLSAGEGGVYRTVRWFATAVLRFGHESAFQRARHMKSM